MVQAKIQKGEIRAFVEKMGYFLQMPGNPPNNSYRGIRVPYCDLELRSTCFLLFSHRGSVAVEKSKEAHKATR